MTAVPGQRNRARGQQVSREGRQLRGEASAGRRWLVSAPDSAAALRLLSQAASEVSRIVCMLVVSASTGWPTKDSCVVTGTPAGVWVKIHSWIPVMPPAVPPYSTRTCSAAAYMVETTVRPWLVHSKDAPGWNGPPRPAAVMSVCRAGQLLTSVCSRQTVSSGAWMSIWWRAQRRVTVYAGGDAPVCSRSDGRRPTGWRCG